MLLVALEKNSRRRYLFKTWFMTSLNVANFSPNVQWYLLFSRVLIPFSGILAMWDGESDKVDTECFTFFYHIFKMPECFVLWCKFLNQSWSFIFVSPILWGVKKRENFACKPPLFVAFYVCLTVKTHISDIKANQ